MMWVTKLMVTVSATLWSGADAKRKAATDSGAIQYVADGQLPQFPDINADRNPIGRGNIPGAFGLLVQVFDTPGGSLTKKQLKQVVIERRFPDGYTFPGTLESRYGRPPRSSRPNRLNSQQLYNFQTGEKPFDFEKGQFVEANLLNVNFIICPFFSTMMWEGGVKFQQVSTRAELLQASITAGLDPETADEHTRDNFFHNPASIIDLWNMEGVQNEHVSSTGINDCQTNFSYCFQTNRRTNGSFGFACVADTDRSCSLPREDIFDQFWNTVDINKDGRVTERELGDVALRNCPGPPETPCECALPVSSGDCQLGDDEFIAQQEAANEPEGNQRIFYLAEDY